MYHGRCYVFFLVLVVIKFIVVYYLNLLFEFIVVVIVFSEVTVIVNSHDLESIKQSLDEYSRLPNSDIEFNTFEVHDSDETGSATALSALKASGRIKVIE